MRDPGIRNQIFLPMMSNDLGYMELDGTFVTIDQNIKCDSTWREDIHHNLKSYIKQYILKSITPESQFSECAGQNTFVCSFVIF